jgi:HD-GYP domain-containing protein (c-di-GMP phosphodiesterase class II)
MAGDGSGGDGRPLDLPGRIDLLSTVVRAVADGQSLPLPGVYRVAEQLDHQIQNASDPIGMLAPFDDEGSWMTVHAHNTAALSLSMATALGLDGDRRQEIGVAAVLHDIGKFGMKEEYIRHDLDLTGAEWELNFNHPQVGLERLLSAPQVPEIACVVAFDHHLRQDGGGFPSLPRPRPPHPAASMVAVAEATDIMLTVRVPRGAMDHTEVAQTLEFRSGDVFEPYLAGIMGAILRVPRF